MRIYLALFFFFAGCTRENLGLEAGDGDSLSGDGGSSVDGAPAPADGGAANAGAVDMDPGLPPDMTPPGPDMACYPHANMCVPGDREPNPNGCQERVCDAACWWGGWRLKAGAACVTGTTQSCNAGSGCPTFGVQRCVSCQWGACTCSY